MSVLDPYILPAIDTRPAQLPRLAALDGVRGAAILMVMLYHMTVFNIATRIDRVWAGLMGFGPAGVDLFFVLSGFLITRILLQSKGAPHYFRNFYARRTLRIFPLYYALVIFSFLILPHIPLEKLTRFGNVGGDKIWYWLYLSNFSTAYRHLWRHGILDVTWSLSIEEQFYLMWPALVLLLSRRKLMYLCGVFIGVSIATRTGLVLAHQSYITVLTLTPCRLDALAVGGWVALFAAGPSSLETIKPVARWVGGIIAVVVLALGWSPVSWDADPLGQCLGFTVFAVAFGALMVLAIAGSSTSVTGRIFRLGWLRSLGKYSYALYLFHLPLRAAVRDLAYGPALPGGRRFLTIGGSQLPGQLLFYAVAIGLSFLAAVVSWNLFEKHFLKMKRFFPNEVGEK